MKASDTIAPAGISRTQGFRAALFIARRSTGADRMFLLEAAGLWPYEAAKLKAKVSNALIN